MEGRWRTMVGRRRHEESSFVPKRRRPGEVHLERRHLLALSRCLRLLLSREDLAKNSGGGMLRPGDVG